MLRSVGKLKFIYELNEKLDFSKTLFLIDIEGSIKLFNDEILELLRSSILVIENHKFLLNKKNKTNIKN